MRTFLYSTFVLAGVLGGTLHAAPVTFQASGANAAAIRGTVDAYRAALGTQNANLPVNKTSGRREVNWDGVPDAISSPNAFPGDFFNGSTPGRARGVLTTTPGVGFEVNPTAASGLPLEFSNIDPSYAGLFAPFSGQKLFVPVGSNITDVLFFLPADQTTRAASRGFGAVFSDVDLANGTTMEYFDRFNQSLGKYNVPAAAGNETFSFFGLLFDDNTRIGRVRIVTGNAALGAGVLDNPNGANPVDVVAMDDFIYADPASVPEPGTWMLLSAGVSVFALLRRRKAGAE